MVDTLSGALKILSRRKIVSSPGDGGQTLQRSLSVVDITCLGETFLKFIHSFPFVFHFDYSFVIFCIFQFNIFFKTFYLKKRKSMPFFSLCNFQNEII
jgi:hypothetical protein